LSAIEAKDQEEDDNNDEGILDLMDSKQGKPRTFRKRVHENKLKRLEKSQAEEAPPVEPRRTALSRRQQQREDQRKKQDGEKHGLLEGNIFNQSNNTSLNENDPSSRYMRTRRNRNAKQLNNTVANATASAISSASGPSDGSTRSMRSRSRARRAQQQKE